MSAYTFENLPYVRFVRQAHTGDPTPLTSTQRTLDSAIALLREASWRQARRGLIVQMPRNDPTQSGTANRDSYDTYKFSCDTVAKSGKQACAIGAVTYRFTLPNDANLGTRAKLTEFAIDVHADKFLDLGVIVACYLSNSTTPDSDFDYLSTGEWNSGTILLNATAGERGSTNQKLRLVLDDFGTPDADTYLYVTLALADWDRIKFEYYIEGGAMLAADTVSVTFNRLVAEDAAIVAPHPEVKAFTAIPLDGALSNYSGASTYDWTWYRQHITDAYADCLIEPYTGAGSADLNARIMCYRLFNLLDTVSPTTIAKGDSYAQADLSLIHTDAKVKSTCVAKRFEYTAPDGTPPTHVRFTLGECYGIVRIIVAKDLRAAGPYTAPLADNDRIKAWFVGLAKSGDTDFALAGQYVATADDDGCTLELAVSGLAETRGAFWLVMIAQGSAGKGTDINPAVTTFFASAVTDAKTVLLLHR